MEKLTFSVPTLFGLEGVCAEELRRMELENVRAENGRVLCQGPPEEIFDSGVLDRVFGVALRRVETDIGWQYYYG